MYFNASNWNIIRYFISFYCSYYKSCCRLLDNTKVLGVQGWLSKFSEIVSLWFPKLTSKILETQEGSSFTSSYCPSILFHFSNFVDLISFHSCIILEYIKQHWILYTFDMRMLVDMLTYDPNCSFRKYNPMS